MRTCVYRYIIIERWSKIYHSVLVCVEWLEAACMWVSCGSSFGKSLPIEGHHLTRKRLQNIA